MISIDREKGYIIISRCDYLYRDGLEKRDDKAAKEMGDGDIIIPLPWHMVDRTWDAKHSTDGKDAVKIIEEIQRRLSLLNHRISDTEK